MTGAANVASAQETLDRVDPARVEREQERQTDPAPASPKVRVEVDAPSGATNSRGPILVGAITLSGLQSLTPADFADVIATRVGQTLAPADLASLATTIAERARAKGYPFASAWIEPQRVASGVLTVNVDEGRIDEIRYDGAAPTSVREALAPLANGGPARLPEVERAMLLAGDIDGVQVSSSRFVREKGRGVLLVRVTQDRVAFRAQLSNEGTRPLGPAQLRLDADLNSVFASGDSLSLTYSGTPVEFHELNFARARYANRINAGGTEVAITGAISRTRPGAYLSAFDLQGRSWFAGIDMLQPLLRERKASLWLQTEIGVRDLTQRQGGTLVRHDRITAARLTLYGFADVGGGRLRVSSTLSQGLGILDSTVMGDALASRWDADGTFTSISNWAEWTKGVAKGVSVRIAAQSQLASQPLLIAEEAALGGGAFLRGYDWSERTGDQGAMAMIEVRYAVDRPFNLIRSAQFYSFFDGGEVSNLSDGFGGGSLASTGGGLRADITRAMGASVEVAVPLTGARYDTGDQSPRVNLRLVRSF